MFVHDGKERMRSLNKTGEEFFCWKRAEAKESNLLLTKYKASNYYTLRHMGLKVAKKKKFNKLQTWTPSSVETRAEPPILPLWVLWVL